MRILVVCGAGTVYGRELITLSLIAGLRDRGHEVTCLTTTWGDGKFARLLDQHSISYTSLPLGFISKAISWSAIWMSLDQIRKLPALWLGYRKAVKAFRPDIVIHSNFHHIFVLWPVLGSAINVFHVHDCFFPTRFYRFVLTLLERRLRLFIGVSKFIAASLAEVGLPDEKIKYVLNGISVERSNGSQRTEKLPATLQETLLDKSNHEDNDPFHNPVSIGIVGQVGEWKGHNDLIEALRLLKHAGEPFACKIFGDGNPSFAATLRDKINQYDLAGQVQWMGFVDGTDSIYSKIDLCVTPSRAFEAFGMVAAEASFHGIPIVATRRGALPEIVLDNQTGYLVDPGSPEQLADKLSLLVRSGEARRRMGLAAREYALQSLTSKRMVEEMETLLYSIVD